MKFIRFLMSLGAAVVVVCWGISAESSTIPVGSSALIQQLDYSDTFTGTYYGGIADRKTDGSYPLSTVDYPVNGVPGEGLAVENCYGNPAQYWADLKFSIAMDGATIDGYSTYPGSSGGGSSTGITQTGGMFGDFGIGYGLRDRFAVQFDAVMTHDRVSIGIGPDRDNMIVNSGGLYVIMRTAGGVRPQVSLANFSSVGAEVDTGLTSGLTLADIGTWHNFAAAFDLTAKTIEVFIDQTSCGTIDLNTFAGGSFATLMNNQNVNVSWDDVDFNGRFWMDNFQVGAVVPEPNALFILLSSMTGLLAYAWRKRR